MRHLALVLSLVLLLGLLCGCGGKEETAHKGESLAQIMAEKSAIPEDLPQPEPQPAAAPAPEPLPEPAPEPLPEPEPEPKTEWTLCFAGDTTIGTLEEWQGNAADHNMLYAVGENYAYPLSGVRAIFEEADFTMVNLEGTLTNELTPKVKKYRFRAPPAYAAVLTEGCVDAVSLDNNHSGDYFEAGLAETKATLDANGILWASREQPLIAELEGGIKIGIVSYNTVETEVYTGDVWAYMQHLTPQYQQLREAGCDLVIGFMHWGWEYTPVPETWVTELAHQMADLGFDLIVGSHAHILQTTEYYNGVPIFYSLGNFCYGGHSNPDDKDCVIVRQHITLAEDGTLQVGETEFLPCSISSSSASNTFCPTPYAVGSEDYERVMGKLDAAAFFANSTP